MNLASLVVWYTMKYVCTNFSQKRDDKEGGIMRVMFLILLLIPSYLTAKINKDIVRYLPKKKCDSIHVLASPIQGINKSIELYSILL